MARRSVRTVPIGWRNDPSFQIPRGHATSYNRLTPFKRRGVSKRYRKVRDVAAELNIGYSTLLKHIRLGICEAQPYLKGYRIPDEAVPEYLERLYELKG